MKKQKRPNHTDKYSASYV